MMIKRVIVSSILVAAAAVPGAQAQTSSEGRGGYIALSLGLSKVSDTELDYSDEGGTFGGTGPRDTLETEVELKNALNIRGAVGYDFGIVRSDLELDYSRNRIEALTIQGLNGAAVNLSPTDVADFCDYVEADGCGGSGNRVEFDGGRVRQLTALANIWLDIPTGTLLTPYVGGGVGVAGFEIEGEGKAKFAWQLGAGVAAHVSPNLALTADYRFRTTGATTFTDDEFPEYALQVGKIQTNTIAAGLRFSF
jgi:opacity protein-like surface antigen